jgi:hypothetical protein
MKKITYDASKTVKNLIIKLSILKFSTMVNSILRLAWNDSKVYYFVFDFDTLNM